MRYDKLLFLLDENAAAFVPGRNLVWQVGSPRAFKLASDCLTQCTLRHNCPKPQETSLPTRVIDCSDPERPKLVLTKGMQGFYAALSYVWGEPQPHSVCTTKLSTYLESIDILLLPKTIRDAIFCTHNLNLRYLWADTLCILQDSDEDKQREIPQMCDIYRCAYVTIIAASSWKVSEGFLHNRKKPVETLLPFLCPDGKLGTISVDEDDRPMSSKEPVNRRAWCFQERLLSPRTLVYASHTLQYQCQTAMNEIGDIWNYLPSKEQGELRLPDTMVSCTPSRTLSSNDVEVVLTAWRSVLKDYTQRAVSNPSDRLVAISGIAQLFQRWWGDGNRYIAGLWERDLSTDLLWYRDSPSYGSLVTGQFLAPSWSWAATIGCIVAGWDKRVGNIIWEVQSCNAIPVSDNHPLGQVKGGRLIVRAIMRDVTWDPAEPELFELKRPCVSVTKTGDEPEDRDEASSIRSLPASGAADITVDTRLAVKDSDQMKITTLPEPNAIPTSASPVKHTNIRMCIGKLGKKASKAVNISRSFTTNLFLKLVPCLVRRKNAHTTETAPARQPSTSYQITSNDTNENDIQVEVMTPQDHSTNTDMVVASTEVVEIGCVHSGGEPDHMGSNNHAKTRQFNEATVPSKERERHIGYGYFDYDTGEIGADKGKAVVVGSNKGENPSHLTGLIVIPAGSTGEYRRVGLFHVHGKSYEDEDEEAPHCDIQSWLNTPNTEVITII